MPSPSLRVSLSGASRRPAATTLHPSLSRAFVAARPIPDPAPVTTAIMVAKGKGSDRISGTIRLMWRGRLRANIRSMFSRRKEIPMTTATLRIRQANHNDSAAVERLAALDSSRAPQGDVLLAEVGGELWAAFSLQDGHHI